MEVVQDDPKYKLILLPLQQLTMKNIKEKIKAFFSFLNPFLFGLLLVGGLIWWCCCWWCVVVVWWLFYIVVAIAPISAISKQYIIIGNMSMSISSTL